MLMMLPDLQPDELMLIQNLTKDMTESQQQQFYIFLKSKRKEKKDLLILTILGFFGVAGIQRFVIGEIGMGIVYLLTIGFCCIGTIVDLVNLDKMASRFILIPGRILNSVLHHGKLASPVIDPVCQLHKIIVTPVPGIVSSFSLRSGKIINDLCHAKQGD